MKLFDSTSSLLINEHSIRKHLVILGFGGAGSWLLQDHTGSVDHDIDSVVLGQDLREQILDRGSSTKITSVDGDGEIWMRSDGFVSKS